MNEFMVIFEKILNIISGFISGTLLWPVVVFVIAIIFRKAIYEKILSLKKLKGHGLVAEFSERTIDIEQKIDCYEKNINQITVEKIVDNFKDNDNPEIAIPRIYSKIETAIKDKFGKPDSFDMLASLYNDKKIDTGTFIILDSMRTLRDDIHHLDHSQKITRKDIDNYEHNAKRIISIIQAIGNEAEQ